MKSVEDCPRFTITELEKAVITMKTKETPDPDGHSAEVYKVVVHQRPDLLLGGFSASLNEGIFLCHLKVVRFALISKGKGVLELPSAYQLLYMLDMAGKVLEKLNRNRLAEVIRAAGDL